MPSYPIQFPEVSNALIISHFQRKLVWGDSFCSLQIFQTGRSVFITLRITNFFGFKRGCQNDFSIERCRTRRIALKLKSYWQAIMIQFNYFYRLNVGWSRTNYANADPLSRKWNQFNCLHKHHKRLFSECISYLICCLYSTSNRLEWAFYTGTTKKRKWFFYWISGNFRLMVSLIFFPLSIYVHTYISKLTESF